MCIRDRHYLVVAENNKRVSIAHLNQLLGNEKLSFASERRLTKYLNLAKGSVSPFGIINDADNHVVLLIDDGLKESSIVNFHPNENTATVSLSFEDFEQFLKWSGNPYRFVTL